MKTCEIKSKKVPVLTSLGSNAFGGHILKSLHQLEVPVMIAGELTKIAFDVVDGDLPRLLGKCTMKNKMLSYQLQMILLK